MAILLFLLGVNCKQSKNNIDNVSKIIIYYVEWSLTTFAPLSCDDLVTPERSVTLSETAQITEFLSTLANASLHELPEKDYVNTRVCCRIYDSNDNVVKTISFGSTTLMQINEKVYNTDQDLFKLVLSYLPQDYLNT